MLISPCSNSGVHFESLYNQVLQSDEHLKFLVDLIPKEANTEQPNLMKYQIDLITLTILNFTSYAVRVDQQRKLFIDDIYAGAYAPKDCHIIFYQLKDKVSNSQDIFRMEKDDTSRKISNIELKKYDEYWLPVVGGIHVPLNHSSSKEESNPEFELESIHDLCPYIKIEASASGPLKNLTRVCKKIGSFLRKCERDPGFPQD